MAAYAAITSLKNIILNLQNHPSPPISIDKQQVRSLTEVLTFLQEFLQRYNSNFAYSGEADPLETRIADAAHKAEDVIESEIVDQIRIRSTNIGEITSVFKFYQDLQWVVEEMDKIKKVAMTINTDNIAVRPQLRRHASTVVGSSASSSSTSSSTVGFDDALNEVLEKLMGSRRNLQTIPITGMGGIGKTTLARKIFENSYVKEHFYFRAWATVSQDYNAREALKELLHQAKGKSCDLSESELGLELYQCLSGQRYLIVIDDMWSIEVWDNIRHYFPESNEGSRIIVTTRLSNLASHFSNRFDMKFLDDVSSWNLFSKTVFGDQSFPLELEDIGKNIARDCRGLPLSIVIIGGLLAKSEQTREYWEHVGGNLNSVVNSEDEEYCLRILKMSYNHLPVHLKPCFLYLGMFKEDQEIYVSKLVKLWVSEGFLEPTSEKSLEMVAKENLKDLSDRNLIIVHKLGLTGNIKTCKMHDLLRDLCMREAEKERFYGIVCEHIPRGINNMRRIVIRGSTSKEKVVEALQSMRQARSLTYHYYDIDDETNPLTLLNFRLLRTFQAYYADLEYVLELVNLSYLSVSSIDLFHLPSSFNLFWNLQTLSAASAHFTAPAEIWNMSHIRHVKLGICLPEPPIGDIVIMENLQTLDGVLNFKLSQEVVKRIPNVKKLGIEYYEVEPNEGYYCLNHVECLHKLESFKFSILEEDKVYDFVKTLTFPHSLKKLCLYLNGNSNWEEMLEKIGSLPLLRKLTLIGGFFRSREWVIVEGQFRKLESLLLISCSGLERWTLESSDFPLIKDISLVSLGELEEISSEIGEIPNLQRISVVRCNMSAVKCLKKIVEEQEDFHGVEELPFQVEVILTEGSKRVFENVPCDESTCELAKTKEPHYHQRVFILNKEGEELQRTASPNFQITIEAFQSDFR